MTSLEILGCRLDVIDADDAVTRILTLAREQNGAQIVTLGTEMVVHAQDDPRFRAVINASALSLCDTVGLLAVARRRGTPLRERVTGIELLEMLCVRAAAEGVPVYFLGGAEGVAADAAAVLTARNPGLRVAGTRNGFFSADESAAVAAAIRASGAELLFVALGSPRQEFWLADHLRETGCSVGIGIGGSLDVISGRVHRAPRAFRRLGMEWFYRLVSEPQRWRRQLALPRFAWLIFVDELKSGRKRRDIANS